MTKELPSHIYYEHGKYRVRYRKSKKFPFEYDEYFDTLEEAKNGKENYNAKNTLNLLSKNNTKDIGFSDFCDYYLEWYRNKSKRPSHNTLKGYISKINQLKKLFGNTNLREISSYQIELILSKEKNRTKNSNGAENEKISAHTLHHEYTMLRILFNKAFSWKFIDNNPISDVEEPYFEEKEIIVPEFEELENIEEKIYKCPIREKCQFLLALYTGMREEEVCGVHKEDFNFEEKYVSVNRAIVQNQETREYVEDKTKSQKSIRKIPLPNKFFEVLEEYYAYRKSFVNILKSQTNNTYIEIPNVFLNKDGGLYRPYRISRLWSKFAKENGINLTFHGLRHYYITNQMNYNDNLSERDVQELAGHSNINTTYKYVHSSKNRIQNNATNLFTKFSKEELYKNGNDTLTIPITHIATIILGNPKLSKTDDLQITLAELSNSEVDFFNISNVMEDCKDYLLLNYPSLEKIEKYRYSNESEKNVITNIIEEFGNEFVIDKEYELNDSLSL